MKGYNFLGNAFNYVSVKHFKCNCNSKYRNISLTMGAGGLMNKWGDHSILVPYLGGSVNSRSHLWGDKKNSSS